ncbi:MAG: quinone-dependent dihydroorotate dehydrogenase, partial [Pseudomonadales bacterium]|nr:quinone-dependent dihydroorotate dehydrogenase [Pseudomonadales bacterium]
LVKIAPDMAHDDLLSVADQLQANGIDGIIATNTTIDKQSVKGHAHCDEAGGLSGSVLFEKSTEIVATLSQHLGNEMVIVGVGGINSPEQAVAKIAAGADLVQLYSGLIYQGPSLIRQSAIAIRDAQCES